MDFDSSIGTKLPEPHIHKVWLVGLTGSGNFHLSSFRDKICLQNDFEEAYGSV